MTKNEEKLIELGFDLDEYTILLFSNPSFEGALIGVENGKAVYDYDLMVEAYMKDEKSSAENATEWISYNTERSLPYYPNSPIIKYNDEDLDEDYEEDREEE